MSAQPQDLYFNTCHQRGLDLVRREEKALSQAEAILAVFRDHRNEGMTPDVVMDKLQSRHPDRKWILTSVRARMSVLTDNGELIKTRAMVKGEHGHPVHMWVMT